MRTALVTPTWLYGPYLERITPFLKYYADVLKVPWDVVLIDNGSDFNLVRSFLLPYGGRVHLVRFPIFYGRTSVYDYLFEWRAYYFARTLLREFEYDKLVFVESDFMIVSPRMLEWTESLNGGWSTVWCAMYGFPESAFQVITPCREFLDFTAGDFREHNGRCMEQTMPFTLINRDLIGDRYSEQKIFGVPAACDYVAQMKLDDMLRLVV